jgi:hypothetical protein
MKTILITSMIFLLFGCNQPVSNGTTWGVGSFDSNGERIFFTATSESGSSITYTGGAVQGMMKKMKEMDIKGKKHSDHQ